MKLFALLIGINDYSKKCEPQVPSLSGCTNDVKSIANFLRKNYSNLLEEEGQLLILTNEKATRDNVIGAFTTHISKATENDTVLIYYSGHGSFGITANDFQRSITDRQEQTWVLYDSRENGKYDLADKEIALLLEIASANNPHILVISDSCHSGSVTREIEEFKNFIPRFVNSQDKPRSMESYLNGAYLNRPNRNIPSAKHLLFAACDRSQRAWETDGHGVFTSAILSVLNSYNADICYADLFTKVRSLMANVSKNQTPQINAIGGFSLRAGILGKKVTKRIFSRYRVFFENKEWKIDLGSGTGLDISATSPIEIEIFDSADENRQVAISWLNKINVTQSTLLLAPESLDKSLIFWGEPSELSLTPFFVYADDIARGMIEPALSFMPESRIYLVSESKAALATITFENNNFLIFEAGSNIMIQGIADISERSVESVIEVLQTLARWYLLLALKNKQSGIEDTAIEFKVSADTNNGKYDFTESQITLEHDDLDIPFKCIVTNKSQQKLYVALFYLSPSYGIEVFFNDSQPLDINVATTVLDDILTLEAEEEIDTFKLIVSTVPIDAEIFSQEGLNVGAFITPDKRDRALKGIKRANTTQYDWFSKTIAIRLVAKGKQIIGLKPISVGNYAVIEPHPTFRGDFNLTQLISKTTSASNLVIKDDYFISNPYFQIVDFSGPSRGTIENRIIEVSNIQNHNDLKYNPLIIKVPVSTGNDFIFPFFFDGEDFIPVGAIKQDSEDMLSIAVNKIPLEKTSEKTRSIGTAIRMLFIKFVNKLGAGQEPQTLAWVDYSNNSIRKTEDLSAKIQTAKKILLLIHGIIGDTEEMAKIFSNASNQGYDLVLTYDYENLNTSIEKNAEILYDKLTGEGFGIDDKKELVLIVHSMGGLVARYLIENLKGDAFIDKLIMAGTPNNGSKFGNIPTYLNWLSVVLGLGVKLFPGQLGSITGFLSAIFKTSNNVLLPSLKQMDADSPFIKSLSKNTHTKIPYHTVGGDLEAYLKSNNNLPLMEKLVAQLGEWVYANVKNDIAVSNQSIFSAPGSNNKVVSCHHLNYFTVNESMKLIDEVL